MVGRRGSTAIEFALVMPVLVVLLVGAFEVAWFFHLQRAVTDAAVTGARRGAVTGDPVAAQDAALDAISPYGIHGVTVEAELVGDTGLDERVEVTISATHQDLTGLIPVPALLQGRASMHAGPTD